VKDINKVVRIGDKLTAKIIRVEPNGRIGLSRKGLAGK
jgi:predicted RNA-binding protein with RPS1 domain